MRGCAVGAAKPLVLFLIWELEGMAFTWVLEHGLVLGYRCGPNDKKKKKKKKENQGSNSWGGKKEKKKLFLVSYVRLVAPFEVLYIYIKYTRADNSAEAKTVSWQPQAEWRKTRNREGSGLTRHSRNKDILS